MRARINALLVLAVAGTIAVLSVLRIPAGDGTGSVFQLGHFTLYFMLAAALLLYFHDTPRGHVEAVLVAGLFGILIEGAQFMLPFRHFSTADMAVNFLGASIVLLDHRADIVHRIIAWEDALIQKYIG